MSGLTKKALILRVDNLIKTMNAHHADWDGIVIVSKVNQYYYTGTMQDALLLITRDGSVRYFVRRSFNRAKEEFLLDNIYEINSYKDILPVIGDEVFGTLYAETEVMPVAMLERLKKHLKHSELKPIDGIIKTLRSIKSAYELEVLKECGELHNDFLINCAPKFLKEGISAAEYMGSLYAEAVKMGHQGFCRFAMFQTEIALGQISFGENTLYPTNFDGPGGQKGEHPATPALPDRTRLLKKGDLVFVDVSFGVDGYHTDKTQLYIYGTSVPQNVEVLHKKCLEVQKEVAKKLKPNNLPCDIYKEITDGLSEEFKRRFMGTSKEQVKFLGHGTGLNVDEFPIISPGFKAPLAENMVIAVEPKYHIEDVGVVGVEDTYVVTPKGGVAITGGGVDIICVG